MSKDKHKGVKRRLFALANLPRWDQGKKKCISGFYNEPSGNGEIHRPWIDISKDIRELEKLGMVSRKRVGDGWHGSHIRKTKLISKI